MEFRVGQIKAKCPACGYTDFDKPEAGYVGPQVNYSCTRCRCVSTYSKLMHQIGKETMRLRKERSEGAPKRPPPQRVRLR